MPPDFLHRARSFHQGGRPADWSSLAGSWGRGLVVNEQTLLVHAWSWSGGKDLPSLPRWIKHGHAVPSADLPAKGDAGRAASKQLCKALKGQPNLQFTHELSTGKAGAAHSSSAELVFVTARGPV